MPVPDMTSVKLELAAREFFSAPPRKIVIEEIPETGRVYFLFDGRIVAVAKPDKQEG